MDRCTARRFSARAMHGGCASSLTRDLLEHKGEDETRWLNIFTKLVTYAADNFE